MVKLTEDMIVARTRVSDLSGVKKLNCWGADIDDVSVLKKCNNVEMLSLRYIMAFLAFLEVDILLLLLLASTVSTACQIFNTAKNYKNFFSARTTLTLCVSSSG
mgnify:FL=1